MIRLQIIGRLGKDPELKISSSGKSYCTLNIASIEKRKTKDSDVTDWVYILVWDKLAENVCKYLQKGSRIYAECRITNNADITKKDNYIAEKIIFIDTRPKPFDAAIDTIKSSKMPPNEQNGTSEGFGSIKHTNDQLNLSTLPVDDFVDIPF